MLEVMWEVETRNYTPHQLDKVVFRTLNQEHNARYWMRIAEATKVPRAEFKSLRKTDLGHMGAIAETYS